MAAQVLSGVLVWTMVSGFAAVDAAASSPHHTANDMLRTEGCESCHQFAATRTHVVGVRPTFELPAAYPVAPNGELTCATCHEAKAGGANSSPLVRGALQGEAFCRSCHTSRADEGSPLAHAVRTGAAHTSRSLQSPNQASRRGAASLECQACHDGIMSEGGHWSAQTQILQSGRDLGHPVGVDYSTAQVRSAALTAFPLLNPAIGLENGTVGCSSCHDALSRVPKQLVVDNRGSALCLACHRL
jgi:predicted CXXCH cytochrome family protein